MVREDRTRAGKRRARRMVELYNAGTSVEEIGRLTAQRPDTVIRKLKGFGVPVDTTSETKEGGK